MTPKNSHAPAVSQLAGEIAAEQVFANYFEALKKSYGAEHQFSGLTLWTVAKEVRDIFSAALSEREEKVAKLIEAAKELLDVMETCHECKAELLLQSHPVHCIDCSSDCQQHDEPECTPIYVLHRTLRAALSALGESK